MKYKPEVPKIWQDIHHLGLVSLVQSEARALRSITASVKNQILRLLLMAGANEYAFLGAIRRASDAIEATLTNELVVAKKTSRLNSRKFFLAENIRLHKQSNGQIKVVYDTPKREYIEDIVSSETAAKSYSAYWTSLAMAKTIGVDNKSREIVSTIKLSAPRVGRIVATEIASSYSSELHSASLDLIRNNSEVDLAGRVFKMWNATLDKRTCSYCESKDGTIIPITEEFDIPVHPNCRCIETLIYI